MLLFFIAAKLAFISFFQEKKVLFLCGLFAFFMNFIFLSVIFAQQTQSACVALGRTGLAYVSSVEDKPVVGNGDFCFGDMLHQLFFHAEGSGATVGYQSQAVADAKHVGIYRHGCFVEGDRLDDVGRLAPHAGQFQQIFHPLGHLSAEVLHQHAGHSHQVFGLVVGIRHALDVCIDYFGRAGGQRLGGGEVPVEGWRYHVDPLVGALGREDNGYQQLKGIVVMQFGLGHGYVLAEPGQYLFISFFLSHRSLFL